MNIQYYFNYITIVEESSLTAASRKLHVAQPALSNQVKALENAFGTRLFYRGARNLELTDAGAILYQKAKWMSEVEESARAEILSGILGTKGTLRLGISSSVSGRQIYDVLTLFAEKYPDTVIKVIEAERPELLKKLQNGVVEAVVARTFSAGTENFEQLYKREDALVAAYSPNSDFFKHIEGDSIDFIDLANVPLAIIERSRNAVVSAFKETDVPLNVKFVSTRIQAAMMWADAGEAVALVPLSCVQELDAGQLNYKLLRNNAILVPKYSIMAQKRKYRSQIINNFLHELSDYCELGLDELIFGDGADDDDAEDLL